MFACLYMHIVLYIHICGSKLRKCIILCTAYATCMWWKKIIELIWIIGYTFTFTLVSLNKYDLQQWLQHTLTPDNMVIWHTLASTPFYILHTINRLNVDACSVVFDQKYIYFIYNEVLGNTYLKRLTPFLTDQRLHDPLHVREIALPIRIVRDDGPSTKLWYNVWSSLLCFIDCFAFLL